MLAPSRAGDVRTGRAIAWLEWVRAILRGPLAELGARGGDAIAAMLEPDALLGIWAGATREIGARTLQACARERLLPAWRGDSLLELQLGERRVGFPIARRRVLELDRLDLACAEPEAAAWLDDPLRVIDGLLEDRQAIARVRAELRGSIEHLAGARLAAGIRDRLAATGLADPRLEDPEHFVTDGHPWHPMTRTRMGLCRADVLRHAPELLARTRIDLVDVAVDQVQLAGDWIDRSAWLGRASAGWIRLPIHPVQRRRLPKVLAQLFGSAIRPAGSAPVEGRSLLSLRTLALPPALGLHLKLALGVHTTSARRTVSPMSVHNGPLISALLERIRARDPEVRALQIMAEPAAAGLAPDQHGSLAGELGAILRVVPDPSDAWVCAAMGERWPGSDETVLERACAGEAGDRAQRVRAGLDAWLERLVPATLRLFVAHGVALEVHLQNTLALVEGGRVRGFRVRDLGGIRLHRERLQQAGHSLELAPGSFVITDDLDEVRGKLEHTLVHAQLAHLFEIADALGVPEADSWARAREVVTRSLDRWAADPREPEWLRAAARLERERLLAPRVRAKALLTMRLHERVSDYDYTEVDNPLA